MACFDGSLVELLLSLAFRSRDRHSVVYRSAPYPYFPPRYRLSRRLSSYADRFA